MSLERLICLQRARRRERERERMNEFCGDWPYPAINYDVLPLAGSQLSLPSGVRLPEEHHYKRYCISRSGHLELLLVSYFTLYPQ
jgi:hypothetical protein